MEWHALEYEYIERNSDWFWAAGAVTIAAALLAIALNDILFAIIILLAGSSLIALARHLPEEMHILINTRGVRVAHTFYPAESIHAFAIDDELPRRRVVLYLTRGLLTHAYIPLGDEDPDEVREHLSQFLPEINYYPSLIDRITEYLGA